MTSSNPHSSYFEAVFGKPVNVVWFLRAVSAAALIIVLLAACVWTSGRAHNFCLGLASGTLIGLLAQTFAIKSVQVNQDQPRSDVERYPLT